MPTTWGLILICSLLVFVIQIICVIIIFSKYKRIIISLIYVFLFGFISYLGSPIMIQTNKNNLLYWPSIALFAYTVLINGLTVFMLFISRGIMSKEVASKLFSTISFILVIPYCNLTNLYFVSPSSNQQIGIFLLWALFLPFGFAINHINGLTPEKLKSNNLRTVLHSAFGVIYFAIFTGRYLGPYMPMVFKNVFTIFLGILGGSYFIYILAIRGGEKYV